MENLNIYIYDSTQIRAKRDMTEKIYSIPQNAKLSTLFNNMFCHRLDLDCGVRQFKYQKLFFYYGKNVCFLSPMVYFAILRNLLPKLFWPIVRKNCSSDREKLLKFEAEGRESLEQFKGQSNFGNRMLF